MTSPSSFAARGFTAAEASTVFAWAHRHGFTPVQCFTEDGLDYLALDWPDPAAAEEADLAGLHVVRLEGRVLALANPGRFVTLAAAASVTEALAALALRLPPAPGAASTDLAA